MKKMANTGKWNDTQVPGAIILNVGTLGTQLEHSLPIIFSHKILKQTLFETLFSLVLWEFSHTCVFLTLKWLEVTLSLYQQWDWASADVCTAAVVGLRRSSTHCRYRIEVHDTDMKSIKFEHRYIANENFLFAKINKE